MPPQVATIILNWQDAEQTLRCIAAAAATTYPNQCLYVFDNGATDASRVALAPLAGQAVLLENPVNLGYTGGNNRAITRALADGAEYVWLLNSDAITGPAVLASLVALAEADPDVGIVTPLIRDNPQAAHCEFAGALADFQACAVETTGDSATGREWQDRFPDRFVVVGTAMLLRRRLIETIGLFDEQMFAYAEDTDYAIRSLRAGFANRVDFAVEVYHQAKSDIRQPHGYYYMNRNAVRLWRKHVGRLGGLRALAAVANRALRDVERFTDGHERQTDAALAGLWDGIRGVTGAYDPDRRMPFPLAGPLKRRPALFRWLLRWL
ncbi:MAG: glycosyltransferase family 2 protein [Nevskia sp.]|nr:glycosyltransferase family 2 protein [Nevskia sp.]